MEIGIFEFIFGVVVLFIYLGNVRIETDKKIMNLQDRIEALEDEIRNTYWLHAKVPTFHLT